MTYAQYRLWREKMQKRSSNSGLSRGEKVSEPSANSEVICTRAKETPKAFSNVAQQWNPTDLQLKHPNGTQPPPPQRLLRGGKRGLRKKHIDALEWNQSKLSRTYFVDRNVPATETPCTMDMCLGFSGSVLLQFIWPLVPLRLILKTITNVVWKFVNPVILQSGQPKAQITLAGHERLRPRSTWATTGSSTKPLTKL